MILSFKMDQGLVVNALMWNEAKDQSVQEQEYYFDDDIVHANDFKETGYLTIVQSFKTWHCFNTSINMVTIIVLI